MPILKWLTGFVKVRGKRWSASGPSKRITFMSTSYIDGVKEIKNPKRRTNWG
jgi:hypothetical protein